MFWPFLATAYPSGRFIKSLQKLSEVIDQSLAVDAPALEEIRRGGG
jgi:hypothetical protein